MGNTYWYITDSGDVDWHDDEGDLDELSQDRRKFGNYFTTIEDAARAAEALKKFWKEYRSE